MQISFDWTKVTIAIPVRAGFVEYFVSFPELGKSGSEASPATVDKSILSTHGSYMIRNIASAEGVRPPLPPR
jgi:hypothetical protein